MTKSEIRREDELLPTEESFLASLKAAEGERKRCASKNPDGVQCEKSLQSDGRDHEGRHVAWVAGTRVMWEVASRMSKVLPMPGGRVMGFEGDPCPECGAMMMVRNGACLKCTSCGATTGCS